MTPARVSPIPQMQSGSSKHIQHIYLSLIQHYGVHYNDMHVVQLCKLWFFYRFKTAIALALLQSLWCWSLCV